MDLQFLSLPCLLLLATATSMIVASPSDWTTSCPSFCSCRWSRGKRTAECNAANLTHLPHFGQPDAVQVLDASENALARLRRRVFSALGLLNLQRIYLSHCGIGSVHSSAFDQLVLLIELDLSHNELSVLKPNLFRGNVRLKSLDLSFNRLRNLPTFPDLKHLRMLNAAHNRLQHFHLERIARLENLEILELQHNNLINFTLVKRINIKSLSLHSNPWTCECQLLKTLRQVVEMRLVSSNPALSCINGSVNEGFRLALKRMRCDDEKLAKATTNKELDTLASASDLLSKSSKASMDISVVFVFGVCVCVLLSVVLATLSVATYKLLRPSRSDLWHSDLAEDAEPELVPGHQPEEVDQGASLSRREARLVWIVAKDKKCDVV